MTIEKKETKETSSMPMRQIQSIKKLWKKAGLQEEISPLKFFVQQISNEEIQKSYAHYELVISILSNIIDCANPADCTTILSNSEINALCRIINQQENNSTYLVKDLSKILTYFFIVNENLTQFNKEIGKNIKNVCSNLIKNLNEKVKPMKEVYTIIFRKE